MKETIQKETKKRRSVFCTTILMLSIAALSILVLYYPKAQSSIVGIIQAAFAELDDDIKWRMACGCGGGNGGGNGGSDGGGNGGSDGGYFTPPDADTSPGSVATYHGPEIVVTAPSDSSPSDSSPSSSPSTYGGPSGGPSTSGDGGSGGGHQGSSNKGPGRSDSPECTRAPTTVEKYSVIAGCQVSGWVDRTICQGMGLIPGAKAACDAAAANKFANCMSLANTPVTESCQPP